MVDFNARLRDVPEFGQPVYLSRKSMEAVSWLLMMEHLLQLIVNYTLDSWI